MPRPRAGPDTTDAAWELLIKPALARLGADADRVTFLPWRFREKNFWSQQIAQNHCIYKARGAGTRAVISTDIDEFLEPQTANQRVVDVVLATVIDRGLAAWRIVMRAVALERTTKHQTNIGDLYAKHNGRASGPLWSAKIGRGNRVGGADSVSTRTIADSPVHLHRHQEHGEVGPGSLPCRLHIGAPGHGRAGRGAQLLERNGADHESRPPPRSWPGGKAIGRRAADVPGEALGRGVGVVRRARYLTKLRGAPRAAAVR